MAKVIYNKATSTFAVKDDPSVIAAQRRVDIVKGQLDRARKNLSMQIDRVRSRQGQLKQISTKSSPKGLMSAESSGKSLI